MARYQWSLRLALSLYFASVMSVVIAVMAYSHYQSVHGMSEVEAENFVRTSNAQAEAELRLLLSVPFRLQKMTADHIAQLELYRPGDMRAVEAHLRRIFENIYANGLESVNMVQMGSENGDFVGISHKKERGEQRLLHLKDERTAGRLMVTDDLTGALQRSNNAYDPRIRPWYAPVARDLLPHWTPMFASSTNPLGIGIAATYPVMSAKPDAAGRPRLLGVLGSDVSLSSISELLHNAPLPKMMQSALIYIVDDQGQLVALSNGAPLVLIPQDGGRPRLVRATDNANLLVVKSYAAVKTGMADDVVQNIDIQGKLFSVFGSRFQDADSIDWQLISVVSKDELTAPFKRNALIALAFALATSAAGLLLGLLLIKRAVEPIRRTAQAVRLLAASDAIGDATLQPMAQEQRPSSIKEATQLTQAFRAMSQRIIQQLKWLKEMALKDGVTGLLNTRGLMAAAQWTTPRPALLVLIGVDHYAAVTAMMRSNSDDALLRAIASVLQATSPHATWIARDAGAQFLLLYLDKTPEDGTACVTALQQAFARPLETDADELSLEVSIGVTHSQCCGGEVATRLQRECALALLTARKRHGVQAVFFEPTMYTDAATAALLLSELRAAIDAGQFLLHFQPIVQIGTGEIMGLESLVRWRHPERGLIPPGLFIPLAEESGLIIGLGTWILSCACREVAQLMRDLALPETFFVNVNVSVRQLLQADFVAVVEQAVAHSGIASGSVKLEITESLLMQDNASTQLTIATLQGMGIKLALDDFGTGYSSLAYLTRIGFHTIKIDRSLLLSALRSPAGQTILRSALDLTRGLRAQCVVEGVEDEAQADLLLAMGFEYAQGYLFGRPAPLADLRDSLVTMP